MAVRRFVQGDSDYAIFEAASTALKRIAYGAFTMAVLTKKELDGQFLPLVMAEITGSSTPRAMVVDGSDQLSQEQSGSTNTTPVTLDTLDGWSVAAITKPAGSSTLRGHKGVLGGAWTHSDGGTVGDADPGFTDPTDVIRVANLWDSSDFDSGLYAVVAVWDRALADSEFTTPDLRSSLENWKDTAPDLLLVLNQLSTSVAIPDLGAAGSRQVDLQGTSVVLADDPPSFDFGSNAVPNQLTDGVSTVNPGSTASIDPQDDSLILVTVALTKSTGPAPSDGEVSISGLGMTWALVDTSAYTTTRKLYVFRAQGTPSGPAALSVSYSGSDFQEMQWSIVEWISTAQGSNGSNAIGAATDGSNTGTSLTVTTTHSPVSGDATFAAFGVEESGDVKTSIVTDEIPSGSFAIDGTAIMIGNEFTTIIKRRVTALRFYGTQTAAGPPGTVELQLWDGTAGAMLSRVTLNSPAEEWNEVSLPSPIDIEPGTTYGVFVYVTSAFTTERLDLLTDGVLSAISNAEFTMLAGRALFDNDNDGETYPAEGAFDDLMFVDVLVDGLESEWSQLSSRESTNVRHLVTAWDAQQDLSGTISWRDDANSAGGIVFGVIADTGAVVPTVDLSPGSLALAPVALTPVPGPVTVALSPGVMTFAPVAIDPQPGVVTIDLSPGVLDFQAIPLSSLAGESVMLSPGSIDFQAVPLTLVPGLVTMNLSVGVMTFDPVAIGQTGVEVDVNVIIGPSRTGTVLIGKSRANGMSVGPTRELRGN